GSPRAPLTCRCLRSGRLGLLDQRLEGGGLAHGEVGEDLAVERDPGLAQPRDEARVAEALLPGRGVDARDPQAAELGLLVAAVAVRVVGGVEERLGCDADALGP